MGLVLRCKVLGVPTMWTTGTCSEKAGGAHDGLSGGASELEKVRTSSDTVDSAQFSDTESEYTYIVGQAKS